MTSIPYLVLIMTCLAGLFWGASCEGAYSGNFLIENCNWRRRHFLNNLGAKVNVSIARFADHNLSRNLTCITNIYALEGYLRLKVSRFSLLGSSSCRTSSERLKIFHHGLQTNNYITWCGETYAEELYFKDTVVLEYNTGLHGEGDGFDIEVSRVGRPCGNVQTLAVTNKTRLLYSPLYPDPYPHRLDCYYRLLGPGKNLRIRSLSHDIEWDETCDYDVLQINQRKFCGSEIIDVLETAQSTDTSVTFSTDGSYAGAGYVLEYFNEQDLSVVCDGDTSLNPIDLQGGENSHFIELKIKQTGRR
ncbi:cubilin [Aplysia californica]|uniref:Cubilin n=1 Tax=Aplysia californica TaxID=6500 RepID=A0ABM1A7I8_APLCA|nr:cubilin [Aplysia californica]